MSSKTVLVKCKLFTLNHDKITLSGKIFRPYNKDTESEIITQLPCILFVHQWSKMGGAGQLMDGMARYMTQMNYISMTFDMRGTGNSTGQCTWTCHDEVKDVKFVSEYLYKITNKPIILIGSSAGAPTAGSVIDYNNYILSGIFIGYTFGFWSSVLFGGHYNSIINSIKPKLFIMGDSDEFTSVKQLNKYIKKMKGNVNKSIIVPNVGHFGLEGPSFDTTIVKYAHEFIQKYSINDIKIWYKNNNNNNNNIKNNNDESKNNE
mmetsp:Transcript_106403/g.129743  ORF Transcript_106403/g.129743 Transcript_106403/m.129743 type:complete len:262 (+) Transcript_106403:43-828(+)